ncbi:MAG: YSC84-related protein [Steroidobacteraceae bacterium]|nr:YSC84-related protein [Steroidobacteraceae bacterium]
MYRRYFLAALLSLTVFATGCTTTGTDAGDPATRRQSLNSGVDNALASLYRQVQGSQELVGRAKGVLVFPSVLEAGFVFGAWRGDGALRVNGKTVSFHRTTGGSFGLQAGAQSTAVYLLFMTDDSLARFQASRGWTAGVDASVTMLTVGANAQLTSATSQQPIIGYVLSNQGLMAGVTVDGSRITQLKL